MQEPGNTPVRPRSQRPRPVVLCVLDGWGERAERDNNAIALAEMPNWNRLVKSVPKARLDASAEEVGLPAGQMGNSEVGHMNLGAGRVVMQDLPRIDAAVKSGDLKDNRALKRFIKAMKRSRRTCHLMGLASPGGVHSHQDHMAALARIVAAAGVPVALHLFLDGRDTPPKSAKGYVGKLLRDLKGAKGVFAATVTGRYHAMDRDKRWPRIEKAWRALVLAEGASHPDAITAIQASYDAGVTDEFMLPAVIGDYAGIKDGDGVLMANFRADRARQILTALADPEFKEFTRPVTPYLPKDGRLGMVQYSDALDRYFSALFPSEALTNILGQLVADAGLKQLRIAETEKYPHVTFFLNGGREEMFAGEERILVPSPHVATYDLKPEMSADEVTDKLVAAIDGGRFDLIVVNYANGDMVGHTGVLAAAIKAAECIDRCLGRLEKAIKKAGGVLIVTSDHGNCENMLDEAGDQPHTAHTMNLVPVLMVNAPAWIKGLRDGRLSDVAPTILSLMGLPQPAEMTGRSLIEAKKAETAAAQ